MHKLKFLALAALAALALAQPVAAQIGAFAPAGPGAIPGTSGGGSPTGAAGGSLAGTYPNPTLGTATGTSLALNGCTIGADSLCVTGNTTTSGTVTAGGLLSVPASSAIKFGNRGIFSSNAAGNVQLGNSDAAAPVAQTLSAQSVVAGTSNTAGQDLTISGSKGTGTGAGGSLIFQTAPAGSTGSTQNALSSVLTLAPTAITFSISQNASSTTGPRIVNTTPSGTVPVFVPNRGDTTTGIGAQASGSMSAVVGGAEQQRWAAGGPLFLGTIPTVGGTATPSIAAGSTDTAGEVTAGTSATSVTITFSSTKGTAPFCVVTSQTQLAAFAYTISTTAITVTQTATTGNKIDYHCFQH